MRIAGATVRAIVALGLVLEIGSTAGMGRTEEQASHDEGSKEHAVDLRAFRVADFERRGVRVASAAPGVVDVGVELPGEVRANADRIAHLAPRTAGVAREVRRRIGDSVRAGDVLAVIESETLALFELKAAFDGVVIDRHVVPGEAVSRETAAFIVADLSTVWVDVHVYQSALADLHVDQPVRVVGPAGVPAAEGRVSYIAPVVEQATRTASARVVLPNPTGAWRPGLFVSVTVLTPIEAAVVVPTRALHRFDGEEAVVFVAAGDTFVPRAVTLGRTGRTTASVVAGLAPGERYADEGSFLVKAELAKSEAGHEH